jgi:hypothetical protein
MYVFGFKVNGLNEFNIFAFRNKVEFVEIEVTWFRVVDGFKWVLFRVVGFEVVGFKVNGFEVIPVPSLRI